MGSTSSKTTSVVDIANTFVTKVSTEVLTENTTTASGVQAINISCTNEAHAAATAACSADNKSNNELAIAIIAANPGNAEIAKIAQQMKSVTPASCEMCSASNITMDMNIAISTQAIADNTIANGIQSKLSAALQAELKNKTEGGIGKTSSQVESLTKIKNYVENDFSTKIVNSTLNSYSFSQTLNSSNMKLSNINMKLVGTALGSAIVQNAIKSNSEVASAITSTVKAEAETVGTKIPEISLFGGIGSIFIGIICLIGLIFGARFLMAFSSGGGGQMQQLMQQQAPPVYQQAPPMQQQAAPAYQQAPPIQYMSQPVPQQPQQHPLSNMSSSITQMDLPGINSPMTKSFAYDSYMRATRG
jgi:hypothetical protein